MTPSQTIIRQSARKFTTVDTNGRRLLLRRLTALDTLRLFKAAGPILARNDLWLSMAGLRSQFWKSTGFRFPHLPPKHKSKD